MKKILVTGGGGYIGSHVLRLLAQSKDYNITVIDNLYRGFKEPIDIISKESLNPINFIKMDLCNIEDYKKLKYTRFDGVLHFAALMWVNESVKKPLMYFSNNVTGSINLLNYIKSSNSSNLIFSSTSAIYSQKAKFPFTEESEVEPENPYAESKLMIEKVIEWSRKAYGLNALVLRYFNPCGVSLDSKLGYSTLPSQHLMTNAVRGAMGLQKFELTCGKVDTPDGTTIRDYFNVLDLADAHVIALEALLKGYKGGLYNVGTGKGHSILEIIDIVKSATGADFKVEAGQPRKGELPIVYCDPKKFKSEFKWKPKYTLEQA
ncbi:UDP-glucose 4-epimerase GalE, partial [Patescibacteria group bacterium]